MLLQHGSRETGIEFAVGWFLVALGIGLHIPRPGHGLYALLHAGGYPFVWSAVLLLGAIGLILGSFTKSRYFRLSATVFAMVCWIALGFKFVQGQLWGAAIQAVVAIFLLNACAFRLWRYSRSIDE